MATTKTKSARRAARTAKARIAARDAAVAVVSEPVVVVAAPVVETAAPVATPAPAKPVAWYVRHPVAASAAIWLGIAWLAFGAALGVFTPRPTFTPAEAAAVEEFLRIPEDYSESVSQATRIAAAGQSPAWSPRQAAAYESYVAPRVLYIKRTNPPRLWSTMLRSHDAAVDAILRAAK